MSEPLIATIPPAAEIHNRIGFLLRELQLARRMLRIAKLADKHRDLAPAPRSAAPGKEATCAAR